MAQRCADVDEFVERVKELYEAQQQVGTFAVEQARSLVLALGFEGQPSTAMVPEAAVTEHLSRHLPEEEIEVELGILTAQLAYVRSLHAANAGVAGQVRLPSGAWGHGCLLYTSPSPRDS